MLADDSQTATELYEHFIEANEVATFLPLCDTFLRSDTLLNTSEL